MRGAAAEDRGAAVPVNGSDVGDAVNRAYRAEWGRLVAVRVQGDLLKLVKG